MFLTATRSNHDQRNQRTETKIPENLSSLEKVVLVLEKNRNSYRNVIFKSIQQYRRQTGESPPTAFQSIGCKVRFSEPDVHIPELNFNNDTNPRSPSPTKNKTEITDVT